jgi:hypothetical protein
MKYFIRTLFLSVVWLRYLATKEFDPKFRFKRFVLCDINKLTLNCHCEESRQRRDDEAISYVSKD